MSEGKCGNLEQSTHICNGMEHLTLRFLGGLAVEQALSRPVMALWHKVCSSPQTTQEIMTYENFSFTLSHRSMETQQKCSLVLRKELNASHLFATEC